MRFSWRLLSVLASMVIMAATVGCFGSAEPDQYYMSSTSPSGEAMLIIEYTPPWSFSPHSMHVYGQKNGASSNGGPRQKLLDFELHNDGANLRRDNCSVAWSTKDENEIATIRCNGQEQQPATYVIDVTGSL